MAKLATYLDMAQAAVVRFARARLREGLGLALILLALVMVLALTTGAPTDPSLNRSSDGGVANLLGLPGAILADLLRQTLGLGVWASLPAILTLGWRVFRNQQIDAPYWRLTGWFAGIVLLASAASLSPFLHAARAAFEPLSGGILGQAIIAPLAALFNSLLGPAVLPGGVNLWLAVTSVLLGALGIAAALFGAGGLRASLRLLRQLVQMLLSAALATIIAITGFLLNRVRGKNTARDEAEDAAENATSDAAHSARQNALRRLFTGVGSAASAARHFIGNLRAGLHQPDDGLEIEAGAATATGTRAKTPRKKTASPTSRATPATGPLAADGTAIPVDMQQKKPRPGSRAAREAQSTLALEPSEGFALPPLRLLAEPRNKAVKKISQDGLEANARLLESVLQDFGIKGKILRVRPGPVVTLYELEPAAGVRSSRVVGLADDIARSMSAVSCRVATVPGHNVIGIELPNSSRETVFLRELLSSAAFEKNAGKLTLALGKDIGGGAVLSDLSKMPHLLVAGTTGSGKSVGINTMILSILYRLTPAECRLILIDPKMLELSVYEGVPHLLAPVVTEPKKAVVALKWAVQEMENRYRKMSKIGVRSIDGYNERMQQAAANGEMLSRQVQTGFDEATGEAIFEEQEIMPEKLPYIVVVIDEMADLMLVAGKEIEGAVQRLAQMARAAGVHLITATQRPSVDVITGTIKANFPSRISFQVTSKIDSRTVLGDMGAEQLLGMGDMLFMGSGSRVQRVHGPFVADTEVEKVVNFLKKQGQPVYVEAVTEADEMIPDDPEGQGGQSGKSGDTLYDQAVAIVTRDNRASTSYVQRRLQIGYNRAARLIEEMEEQGVISAPNHAGKREVLAGKH